LKNDIRHCGTSAALGPGSLGFQRTHAWRAGETATLDRIAQQLDQRCFFVIGSSWSKSAKRYGSGHRRFWFLCGCDTFFDAARQNKQKVSKRFGEFDRLLSLVQRNVGVFFVRVARAICLKAYLVRPFAHRGRQNMSAHSLIDAAVYAAINEIKKFQHRVNGAPGHDGRCIGCV
jgi:hypothetical protein